MPVKKDWTKKPVSQQPEIRRQRAPLLQQRHLAQPPTHSCARPAAAAAPSLASIVDKDFPIDTDARYLGRVVNFLRAEGYGFVRPHDLDLVPGGIVRVSAGSIRSEDRCPVLLQNMEVEFSLMKNTERGTTTVYAAGVSLPGGAKVAVQDAEDALKEFVGGVAARYAGRLKFFAPTKGYGYITLDQHIGSDPELGLPAEVGVELTQVNCGGRRPKYMDALEVEFGIYKGEKSRFMAHNMTLPGGRPITDENLLNREQVSAELFSGIVTFWHWSDGWGFITADPAPELPERVVKKMEEMRTAGRGANIYFSSTDLLLQDFIPTKGQRITFNLYIDDKGAGATNILRDVTPVTT